MIGNTSATDYSPTKITISTGQLVSGSNASLSSQDGSFLVINSTQQGSYYITDWYAEFTLSSRQIANLSIADSGKYSTWRGQTLYLYNFSTSSWEIINYSNIGMVMVNVNLPSVANPASYVSAEGKVWLKSYCLSTSSFTAYTDYLKLGVTFGATPAPAANKVAFTSQPGLSNISGTAFGTQPAVNIQDASGNTVTASNAAVTLAITKGTGTKGAALLGTATVNAVNGVAIFSALSINLAGTGYTLTATSTGLTPAASTSFDIGSGNYYIATFNMTSSANSYAYNAMNGVSNYTIHSGDYLQYDVLWTSTTDFVGFDYTTTDGTDLRDSSSLDQNGLNAHPNTDISSRAYNSWYSRKIALPVGQVGKTISYYDIDGEYDGTAIKTSNIKNIRITDVNNVVRKTILVGNEASVSTTLHFSNQGNLVSFVRNSAPESAVKLAFTAQPSVSNTAGVSFGTQPVVKVQDGSGNTVTTSTAPVTLAITVGTGTSGAALSGTVTVNAVNGVATFSGLSINLADTGYILKASSPGLTSTTSTAFNVSAATIAGGEVVVANFIAGDANGDGVVNMADVAKVQRIILGLDSPTPGADADGDGIVSMGDVTKIERIILGLNP